MQVRAKPSLLELCRAQPILCKSIGTKRMYSNAFALSGRTSSPHSTQGVALGYALVAPSGRALNAALSLRNPWLCAHLHNLWRRLTYPERCPGLSACCPSRARLERSSTAPSFQVGLTTTASCPEKIYLLARRRYTSPAIEDILRWKVINTATGRYVHINGKVCAHLRPSFCTYRHVSANNLKKNEGTFIGT